jgi:hypothetical protein
MASWHETFDGVGLEHEDPAPKGSRWYAWGNHWEVTQTGLQRDGMPAVRIRNVNGGHKPGPVLRIPVLVRALVRYGNRTA